MQWLLDALDRDDSDKYMDVYEWCASGTFEEDLSEIAAVPRRHSMENVSTIGLLPNSLDTNLKKTIIVNLIVDMATFREHRCKQMNRQCTSVEHGCHANGIEGNEAQRRPPCSGAFFNC